jgi:hypothetical protein
MLRVMIYAAGSAITNPASVPMIKVLLSVLTVNSAIMIEPAMVGAAST